MMNAVLVDGDVLEYRAHAAALLPMVDYRFPLLLKPAIKNGESHWFKTPVKKLRVRFREIGNTPMMECLEADRIRITSRPAALAKP